MKDKQTKFIIKKENSFQRNLVHSRNRILSQVIVI